MYHDAQFSEFQISFPFSYITFWTTAGSFMYRRSAIS